MTDFINIKTSSAGPSGKNEIIINSRVKESVGKLQIYNTL